MLKAYHKKIYNPTFNVDVFFSGVLAAGAGELDGVDASVADATTTFRGVGVSVARPLLTGVKVDERRVNVRRASIEDL